MSTPVLEVLTLHVHLSPACLCWLAADGTLLQECLEDASLSRYEVGDQIERQAAWSPSCT